MTGHRAVSLLHVHGMWVHLKDTPDACIGRAPGPELVEINRDASLPIAPKWTPVADPGRRLRSGDRGPGQISGCAHHPRQQPQVLQVGFLPGQFQVDIRHRLVADHRALDGHIRHARPERNLDRRPERDPAALVHLRVHAGIDRVVLIASNHGQAAIQFGRGPHRRGKIARGRTPADPAGRRNRLLERRRLKVCGPLSPDRNRLVRPA